MSRSVYLYIFPKGVWTDKDTLCQRWDGYTEPRPTRKQLQAWRQKLSSQNRIILAYKYDQFLVNEGRGMILNSHTITYLNAIFGPLPEETQQFLLSNIRQLCVLVAL